MYKPITKPNNYIPINPQQLTTDTQKHAVSPNRIIQDIMYTPHQAPLSTVTALQSKRKNSKCLSVYTHSFSNTDDNESPHKQIPQSHLSKRSPKRSTNYKPSKFEINQDNNNNNNDNNNDTVHLVKSYSGNYNISQLKSSKALANVVSSIQKQPKNFFFLNKKVSVNETLQNKSLQRLKMSYIHNQAPHPLNANTHSIVYLGTNNTNISVCNNNSSKTITTKNNHSTRNNHSNNNSNNNLLVVNRYNSNDCESKHLHNDIVSKKQSKNAVEIDQQGSALCLLKTSNSDTIQTRKKFSKSKTRKKNQKVIQQHADVLNMKDVLEEIQNEVEPIKICKVIQNKTVESREDKNENKILTLTTVSGGQNNKGCFCKCIPFSRKIKVIK